jgi:hypothetical protein
MRFELIENRAIPAGAWCMTVTRGSDIVPVEHGTAVDRVGDGFFEGVWSGDFAAGDFLRALTRAGTGAVIVDGSVIAVGASAMHRGVMRIDLGDALVLSNSYVFLAARAGVRPCMQHSDYFWDRQSGRTHPSRPAVLRFSGPPIVLELMPALVIDRDLRISRRRLDHGPGFTDFASYRALVDREMAAIAANATSPRRDHPFELVASLSAGYDSTASAVFGARAGWKRAFTLVKGDGDPDDGSELGRSLGYEVEACPSDAWERSGPFPEAGDLVNSGPAIMARVRGAEHLLRRAVITAGGYGDRFWSRDPGMIGPDMERPGPTASGVDSFSELELRLGSVMLHVPAIGVRDATIFDVANSAEMAPWQVGGAYDRPIPRRVIEEAGIARGRFAVTKLAGSHFRSPEILTAASRADYERWLAVNDRPLLRRLRNRLVRASPPVRHQLLRIAPRVPLAARLADRLVPLRTLRWETDHLYHWAFDKELPRYEPLP